MIKHVLVLLIFSLTCTFTNAKKNDLKWLDIELSSYEYPYAVSSLLLNVQR